jgi:RNA polymerase sigma factor (sigma-70 family)
MQVMKTTPVCCIQDCSDEELIQLVLSGCESAFNVLILRYERLVKYITKRYLTDFQGIEEVVQDVFIKAYRHLDQFRGESKFGTWLSRIAVSQAVNYIRREHRNKWLPIENLSEQAQWEDFRPLEQEEIRHLLKRAFQHLMEQDAVALDLFYFREQSIEEICQITGWSNVNTRSRLTRARSRLRNVINLHDLQGELNFFEN